MSDVIQQLQQIQFTLNTVDTMLSSNELKLNTLRMDCQSLNSQLESIIEARQFYRKAIDVVYERSVQELQDVVNSALSFIFKDRNLQIEIVLSDKRGKSLNIVIKDAGKVVSLKRGMGMGVKCVISCILHIYYLQCKGSKILMLDEAYSNISEDYVTHFFEFIRNLCHKLEFTFILITHDKRFIDYADRVYYINNGAVSLIKDGTDVN